MANDNSRNIESVVHATADLALSERISSLQSSAGGIYVQTLGDPVPDPSFLKAVIKGAKHVIAVAWTVPAVRSQVATWLVRFGIPGTLVAIGMAVGEKLAQ